MGTPAHLQPLSFDRAAAAAATAQLAATRRLLAHVMTGRARRRAVATVAWTGPFRDRNDQDDARLAWLATEVQENLIRLERSIAQQVASLDEVNRHRAAARRAWEEQQQAATHQASVRPTGSLVPGGVLR